MPLTREFEETVQARIRQDRKYRKELLREGVASLLAGDFDTGKAILRDYINATIGFEELSRVTKRPNKSLMRMFGPAGNPQARNLFEVIGHLQRAEGLQFELSLKAASYGTGNGEVDRSTLFHARSDDIVRLAVKLFALDPQFSQFLL